MARRLIWLMVRLDSLFLRNTVKPSNHLHCGSVYILNFAVNGSMVLNTSEKLKRFGFNLKKRRPFGLDLPVQVMT